MKWYKKTWVKVVIAVVCVTQLAEIIDRAIARNPQQVATFAILFGIPLAAFLGYLKGTKE